MSFTAYNSLQMEPKESRQIYDGTIHTPFTSLVVGPSGSGKSTFVGRLIINQARLLSNTFDYLYIFLGTPRAENQVFMDLEDAAAKDQLPHAVKIFDVRSIYLEGPDKHDADSKLKDTSFASDVLSLVRKHHSAGHSGCLIFDDLMTELADCNLLVPLFTKISSHFSVSVIYTTQNLYHKGARTSDNVTVFRNTDLLVLFKTPMDQSVFNFVAQKLHSGTGKSSKLASVLKSVANDYRYVVIVGDFNSPDTLRYRTNIFATVPVPNQKIISFHDSPVSKGRGIKKK